MSTTRRGRSAPPAYLLHKATGNARVRIRGKDYYLGPFGSEESRQRYARLIAELAVDSTGVPVVSVNASPITIT